MKIEYGASADPNNQIRIDGWVCSIADLRALTRVLEALIVPPPARFDSLQDQMQELLDHPVHLPQSDGALGPRQIPPEYVDYE